jgi:hypothetical protein
LRLFRSSPGLFIYHQGKILFYLEAPLEFVDGVPQVERMINKMKKLANFK